MNRLVFNNIVCILSIIHLCYTTVYESMIYYHIYIYTMHKNSLLLSVAACSYCGTTFFYVDLAILFKIN